MLIAFSGLKGSGKDTAASVLIEEFGFTKIAFADAVRDMALAVNPIISVRTFPAKVSYLSDIVNEHGWDKAKREIPEVRRILQRVGTEAGRNFLHEDIWISILKKDYPDISWENTRYVITDCRFKNEADFVHESHGDICWIERPGVTSDGHASETDEVKSLADYSITNDDTITELKEDIRFLMFMKEVHPVNSGPSGEVS